MLGSSFFEGFVKRALQETRGKEDAAVALSSVLPFGTTLHTANREGRDGKRLGDFGARTLGALGGVALGGSLGRRLLNHEDLGYTASRVIPQLRDGMPHIPAKNLRKLLAVAGLTTAVGIGGEIMADRMRTGKEYDDKGKRKPEEAAK